MKLSSVKLTNSLAHVDGQEAGWIEAGWIIVHVDGQEAGSINRIGAYSRRSTSSRSYKHYIYFYVSNNTPPYYSNLNCHIDVNQLNKSFYYLMSNE